MLEQNLMNNHENLQDAADEAFGKMLDDKDNLEHLLYALSKYFHHGAYEDGWNKGYASGVSTEKQNRLMSPWAGFLIGVILGLFVITLFVA
jgi:hypothetical protein